MKFGLIPVNPEDHITMDVMVSTLILQLNVVLTDLMLVKITKELLSKKDYRVIEDTGDTIIIEKKKRNLQ